MSTKYQYRIIHHPEPPESAHYRAQYRGGWRTLWCWWTFRWYGYGGDCPERYRTIHEAREAIREHRRAKQSPAVVEEC